MQLNVQAPDRAVLMRQANASLEIAEVYVIDCPAMYEAAADDLKDIKTKAKELEDRRKAITGPLDKAKKEVMDLFRDPMEVLTRAEAVLKRAMLTYQQDEERKRQEEQRRLEAQARQERAAMEAQAAAARAEAEAEAARLREQAESERAAGNATAAEQLLTQATETVEVATAEAAVIEATAEVIPMPTATMAAAKASGISTRGTWKAEVMDKQALIAHVAANPDLLDLLDINQSALNSLARALKANAKLPGVRVYEDKQIAARKG